MPALQIRSTRRKRLRVHAFNLRGKIKARLSTNVHTGEAAMFPPVYMHELLHQLKSANLLGKKLFRPASKNGTCVADVLA
jgi:hypothetical protein